MPINRKPKMKNYTTVDNYFINDINLKPEQKGYLLFMLSKPDEWNFNYAHLTKALGVGEKALRSNIKKLEALHYLKRERLRDKNGKYEWIYSWYEQPYDLERNIENLPYDPSGYMEKGDVVEGKIYQEKNLISTDTNKDKIDKTFNPITNELIKRKFIDEYDLELYKYDNLFIELLDKYDYKQVIMVTDYVISKWKDNKGLDEEENNISNKFSYFKAAVINNLIKINTEIELDWD